MIKIVTNKFLKLSMNMGKDAVVSEITELFELSGVKTGINRK